MVQVLTRETTERTYVLGMFELVFGQGRLVVENHVAARALHHGMFGTVLVPSGCIEKLLVTEITRVSLVSAHVLLVLLHTIVDGVAMQTLVYHVVRKMADELRASVEALVAFVTLGFVDFISPVTHSQHFLFFEKLGKLEVSFIQVLEVHRLAFNVVGRVFLFIATGSAIITYSIVTDGRSIGDFSRRIIIVTH